MNQNDLRRSENCCCSAFAELMAEYSKSKSDKNVGVIETAARFDIHKVNP